MRFMRYDSIYKRREIPSALERLNPL